MVITVAAIALLCIPQTGLKQLPQLYTWTYSIIILAAVANAVTAVFCLVGHFTFYKLQKEVYVNRLPRVLRGSWHTYVGLELQLILSFAMALLEAFITVRWFDFPALAALVLAVAEAVAAFLVRDITFKAYKGLASEGENAAGAPPKPGKKADDGGDADPSPKDGNGAKGNRADDEVEDFFDNKE